MICMLFLLLSGQIHAEDVIDMQEQNRDGWVLTQKTHYDKEGNITSYEYYQYDTYGHILSYKRNHSNGSWQQTYQNEYDASQHLVSQNVYNGENEWISVYEYDKNGNLILEEEGQGNIKEYGAKYTYDKQNHQIQKESYFFCGNSYLEKYEYDKQGRLIRQTDYYKNDMEEKIDNIHEYSYTKNKRIEYEYSRSKKNLFAVYTSYSDDQGNIIKVECEEDGNKPYVMEEYTYDEYGNNIEFISYDPTGEIIGRTVMYYVKQF